MKRKIISKNDDGIKCYSSKSKKEAIALIIKYLNYTNCKYCNSLQEFYNSFSCYCPHLCIVVKIHSQLILKKMNTTELKGNWEEQKGKLKQKFAALTDNDLLFAEGKKEEMIGKLQIKLGKSKEELHKIIQAL
jgi:uncharacterized protein YjbJ (UPF0337 family)